MLIYGFIVCQGLASIGGTNLAVDFVLTRLSEVDKDAYTVLTNSTTGGVGVRLMERTCAENSYAMGQGVHWGYRHSQRAEAFGERRQRQWWNGDGCRGGVTTEPVALIDSNVSAMLLIS